MYSYIPTTASDGSKTSAAVAACSCAGATTDWSSAQLAQPTAMLVEIPPNKPQAGRKFRLAKSVVRIGSDAAQCDVSISNDPFVCSLHGQLALHPADGWHLVDLGSVNGCWVRVDKFPILGPVEVQIGEQRLRIGLGGSESTAAR